MCFGHQSDTVADLFSVVYDLLAAVSKSATSTASPEGLHVAIQLAAIAADLIAG